MAEILSQNEIDALLQALSSGELNIDEIEDEKNNRENKKAKVYDFKRPNKFSKDHVRTLQMIYDNYTRLVANYLTSQLRTSAQVSMMSMEQITFEEFIHSIANPTILMPFYLKPFTNALLFESNSNYVFQVIDILSGGNGKNIIKPREFTEIEKNLIKKFNIKMLELMKLAWEDILEVEFEHEGIETNPILYQAFAPNESVFLITMSVQIEGIQSFINVCIPYISIEKYIDKLVIQYKANKGRDDLLEDRDRIENNLKKVSVNTYVELGRSLITINDFLHLIAGDCIKLDKKINDSLDYYVEDKKHFKVYPGKIGKKLGVKVIDKYEEGWLEE